MIVASVPQEFEFQIVNRTDHGVRLPEPLTTCDDAHRGKLRLSVRFTPLGPSAFTPQKRGGGRAADYAYPITVSEIGRWKVLRAGEVLSVKETGHSMLVYDDLSAGTYVFSAIYEAPQIPQDVLGAVLKMGFDVPDRRLTSNCLTFAKGR